ncbi:hypothetical protein GCM10010919_16950 [Alishewanella longhuensis]|uniref:Carboxypeptidase regulatory-like domain-containing protein n=1 Tax=Alishewanella longhuensis TaxID=1091037 RepID=A0ABQ3KXW0_9ALTE|nr:Ig-like domain-containing protein [Alishewanella longhuensis]GHG67911.1 hypothetical protein GCM10010919_16950 [Alishewanella longhuensis]
MALTAKFNSPYLISAVSLALLTACGGSSKKEEVIVTPPPAATAPVAQNDTAISLNNVVLDIDVLANDTAGSGGALTLTSVTAPTLGTAEIVNNRVRYTPAGMFLGSDTFTYTVTSGTRTATATVNVSGQQSINLTGRVIDSPIADATVKVEINGETFTATADSQGFYTLSILLSSAVGDEIIRVIAQGAEQNNQGFVTLSSLTDTASALLAMREDGQAISNAELSALQLTQITTARDLLIQQLVGEAELTPEQLAEAEISLDVEKLLTTAAAIKLLVDNPAFTLPEGYNTIEEFVLDTAAFTAFVEAASEGENSPLSLAKAATLGDPDVLPAAKPLSGNYLRVFDTPAFMSARTFENIHFADDNLTFIVQTNVGGEFKPVTKPITLSGSTIEIVDPDKTGFQRFSSFQTFSGLLPDDASRATWQANGCPSQINVIGYSGFTKFTVLEQTADYLVAEVESFIKNEPVAGSECAGITPPTRISSGSAIVRYVRESAVVAEPLEFDLAQSKIWILPELSGSQVESELYTLNEDGTFETFTGIYEGSILTWALSEDKKTLTLKATNAFDSGEFNQMELQISRALDSAYTVLTTFSNEELVERFSALKSALPVSGEGVVNVLAATAGTSKFILSSVNSRNKEWQGRVRLPGDWFGWVLASDGTARSPFFNCDGVRPDLGSLCVGDFKTSTGSLSAGTWEVKDNALFIERGLAVNYQSGACVQGEPCNLRVIVPLYEKDGVVTGYEYNVVRRNQFQIMPRVMHWTTPDLPAVE